MSDMNSKHNLVAQFTQIQWLLTRYHHQHRHHQFHKHRDAAMMGDPFRGQVRVLKLLKMKPEITQKELAIILDMRPQSLGDLLKKLESKGLILREPATNDRRAMVIKLTDKGANAEIDEEDETGLDALFQCLSADEREQLSAYLQRIIEDWRSRADIEFGKGHFGFGRWHK